MNEVRKALIESLGKTRRKKSALVAKRDRLQREIDNADEKIAELDKALENLES